MVVVVVVTYSVTPEQLDACVGSVLAEPRVHRLLVVDNGGSAAPRGDDRLEVVRSDRNDGFGAAANRGFRRALEHGARHVVLLNDDLVAEPGWLDPLLDGFGAGPAVGAVQPKLLLAGSDPVLVNSMGVAVGPDGAGVDIGFGEPDGAAFEGGRAIEVFTGGAVMLSDAFVRDTGGFDERYFLYYEDVDLALRGGERGWTYRCEPSSRVLHERAVTTGTLGDRTVFLRERNRLWCTFRHGSARAVGRALWLSIRRVRHRPRAAHARALIAGLAHGPALRLERRRAARARADGRSAVSAPGRLGP